jgi:hypothetical protein
MARADWRDPAKEQLWRRLLDQWQRSGLSGRAFCLRHGLSEPSFYAWRREIKRRERERFVAARRSQPQRRAAKGIAPSGAFVEIAADTSRSSAASIDLVLAGGRLLCVRRGFDAELLRQMLSVLEQPSC